MLLEINMQIHDVLCSVFIKIIDWEASEIEIKKKTCKSLNCCIFSKQIGNNQVHIKSKDL